MKIIFTTLIALFISAGLMAQNNGPSFGIKGGANFSNIIKTGDSDFETDSEIGFHAGIFINIPIFDRLSFQPEAMFSQKGYRTSNNTLLTDGTFTQTTNWIEIPILAKIQATPTISFLLGPQISFLTRTKNELEGDFVSGSETIYEDEADKFKKSILGGTLGLGIDISNNLSLNGRYNLDFQKTNENGETEIPRYKNQVWSLGLGLKF